MNNASLVNELKELVPVFEQLARKDRVITDQNVYQPENTQIRAIISSIIDKLLLEGSRIYPVEHIEEFLNLIKAGKKGIILAEHYSNLDLPAILYLLERSGEAGKALAQRSVAIAGMKLTEEQPLIAALAEGYERIVIYPSRTLAGITDPERLQEEKERSRSINLASMKALEKARSDGKAIIVFPAGTRYRPGKPETKRGVREIDSYVRTSDIMLLLSINGNCLRISEDPANMLEDIICRDRIVIEASPVIDCTEFRERVKAGCSDSDDKKQAVVDRIMAELELMHNRNSAE